MIGFARRAPRVAGLIIACLLAAAPPAFAQTDKGSQDADTRAWWAITGELSGDSMEGRDTGSPGYDRAAQLVADRVADQDTPPAWRANCKQRAGIAAGTAR